MARFGTDRIQLWSYIVVLYSYGQVWNGSYILTVLYRGPKKKVMARFGTGRSETEAAVHDKIYIVMALHSHCPYIVRVLYSHGSI